MYCTGKENQKWTASAYVSKCITVGYKKIRLPFHSNRLLRFNDPSLKVFFGFVGTQRRPSKTKLLCTPLCWPGLPMVQCIWDPRAHHQYPQLSPLLEWQESWRLSPQEPRECGSSCRPSLPAPYPVSGPGCSGSRVSCRNQYQRKNFSTGLTLTRFHKDICHAPRSHIHESHSTGFFQEIDFNSFYAGYFFIYFFLQNLQKIFVSNQLFMPIYNLDVK